MKREFAKNKLAWLALTLIIMGTGTILYHANKDTKEYVAETIIQITDEEKLTRHLAGVMLGQKDARAIRVRAELALQEAEALEKEADDEVDAALWNIKKYQGIEDD